MKNLVVHHAHFYEMWMAANKKELPLVDDCFEFKDLLITCFQRYASKIVPKSIKIDNMANRMNNRQNTTSL